MRMERKGRYAKALSLATSALMAFSMLTPNIAGAKTNEIHSSFSESNQNSIVVKNKVSNSLLEDFKDDEKLTFLIKFKDKSSVNKVATQARKSAEKDNLSAQQTKFVQRSAVVSDLKATSLESQESVKQYLEKEVKKGNAKDIESYYIVNGMAVTATKEVAEKVATFEEVEKVLPNETRQLYTTKVSSEEDPSFLKVKDLPKTKKTAETKAKNAVEEKAKTSSIEWNVERVKAPEAWEMGIDGSGTVVASIDTGVQWDHPALKEKYRGYNKATGQVSNDFNWFDATSAGRATPYDDLGHGTHVTGTMVGSEPNGTNQIGVAPGAKFISVKAFTSNGGTDTDLLEAAEWILAPTDSSGNARVDMAPDVVNNSWGGGPGLDEWYRDVVRNWRAAEIFPEFSAGNTTLTNPGGAGSVAAPANYPESFATGAIDINNKVASFSLRGPSPYDKIKPDISAPGVNIRSSVPGSVYEGGWNGTSMAGPAVSGVAALLRQVSANLTVDEMEDILLETATPLTDSQYPQTPNHGYGYGLVDAYQAVSSIATGLGTIDGQVTKQGEDDEAPVLKHTAPKETYAGMDLELTASASDNISVASVVLKYKDANGDWKNIEALRKSGDYKSGEFSVKVPGENVPVGDFKYKWVVNDFGNNEVVSDEYTVKVKPGITVGYSEDLESQPVGWTSFGNQNSWEWGKPTSGPGNAASGEKVYATNLAGNYANSMNATLVMPPIDLPEGNAFLQFKQWFNFEKSTSGREYDYGTVFVSTNNEDWTQLMRVSGASNGWLDAEVDLSAYAGQRIYIGFNGFSDSSVQKEGWYIDDIALTDSSQASKVSKGKDKKTGVIVVSGKGKDKNSKKEAIDPKTIKPTKPEKESVPVEEKVVNPTLLPLGAQVSILESNRSVYSDPATGSYSLKHSTGTFTAKAEAYGFSSKQQSVTVEADETSTANFTLQEIAQNTVSGKITDESTGEGIEGATLLLKEDANIAPVTTDAEGNYSIKAYHGDYTLKGVARGYNSQEFTVSIGEEAKSKDIQLKPFYTYPGGEIGYDDGTAENARAFNAAGNAWAVKMSLPENEKQGIVTDGVFRFWDTTWPNPGGTAFEVEVWDATGAEGTPGKKLAGPINATALRNGEWTVVDLSEHNIIVNGDFYMVYRQTNANPNAPGLATDEDGKNAERSYQAVSGTWSKSPAEEGNYMIRARVSYEVNAPVITSPVAESVTSESAVQVEGKASPTTEITLKQNGKEAGKVVVGSDGKFSIPATLVEGENTLSAVSKLAGKVTGESEAIKVTLDTENPTLTIDSPQDSSKTNRETVTVEGTIADANLDWVKVNGKEAKVSNGKYSLRILLDEGTNEIKVVAQDKAKNKVTKKVTVTADYTAPVIENLTPAKDLTLTTGKTVKIVFDSEPDVKATFLIHMPLTNVNDTVSNATELPLTEESDGHYVGYWTVPDGTVADGAVIEVKAVDSFKNETRQKAAGKLYINLSK